MKTLILAGGLGTRLRPFTEVLPKPMMSVRQRPLLSYVLHSARVANPTPGPPVVVTSYKADIVKTFFARDDIELLEVDAPSMAEAILQALERVTGSAFLCLSADVLIPPRALGEAVANALGGGSDRVVVTSTGVTEHKKWDYQVKAGILRDVGIRPDTSRIERVALVLRRESIQSALGDLARPISRETLPPALEPFDAGWTLILKRLARAGVKVLVSPVQVPVCNVNSLADLTLADAFVDEWFNQRDYPPSTQRSPK